MASSTGDFNPNEYYPDDDEIVVIRQAGPTFMAVDATVVDALPINALGAWIKLLRLSHLQEVSLRNVRAWLNIGRDRMHTINRQLIRMGVLKIVQVRDKQGRFTQKEWMVTPVLNVFNRSPENQGYGLTVPLKTSHTDKQSSNVPDKEDTENSGSDTSLARDLLLKNKNNKNKELRIKSDSPSKGTRLQEDFIPSERLLEWASENTPLVHIKRETKKFSNYYLSAPGQKGVKVLWDRTWQNWMLSAQERLEQQTKPVKTNADYNTEAYERARAKLIAEEKKGLLK